MLLGRGDIGEGGLAPVKHGSGWSIDEGTGEGLHDKQWGSGSLYMEH